MKRSMHVILGTVVMALATAATWAAEDTPAKPAFKMGERVEPQITDAITVTRDIEYARYGDRALTLDLYLPKKPLADPMPCVVVIHGGGWKNGDKERFAAQAATLAEAGFAAPCIGYRLTGEAPLPACVLDCKAAVRWVRANAAKYGIDPDHIGAFGGSAGAHLVTTLGTTAKVAALEGDGGNPGVSSRVQAVVALAAPVDLGRLAEERGFDDNLVELISPLRHVDADSAPTLLIHSVEDAAVPYQESVNFEAAMEKAGAPVKLITVHQAPHGFWNRSTWYPMVMEESIAFFKQYLLSPDS